MHFLLTQNVCLESANRSQEIIIAKSDSVLGFFCNNNKCSRPKNMEIGYLTLRLKVKVIFLNVTPSCHVLIYIHTKYKCTEKYDKKVLGKTICPC